MKFNASWFYLGSIRQWHWISSAVCLFGMLLFAITGITLNHAADIRATIKVQNIEDSVPLAVLNTTQGLQQGPLPTVFRHWLQTEHAIAVGDTHVAEWSDDEVYLSLPRPGGDAWLSLDRASGELLYEKTERGWVSYLNDLHKGRNTGQVWFWFIDVFAIACMVFCLTGLVLLYRYAGPRPTTWPTVGLGLVIPLLIVILFVHS